MPLPLLERVSRDGEQFKLTGGANGLVQLRTSPSDPRIPLRLPVEGEQYRFHFDMTKCIGCKCCEVACNEQNNNPADIRWRRVGEIEAGDYPFTQRFHLSMGCNHCLDAACLRGCPVDAYTKDGPTGLVLHSADTCIGCQYCTWNCPYGVPQYNPERGVVGKCDMCYNRVTDGREPACVNACPEGAIRIELVNMEDWKLAYAGQANAPGLPSAESTISTTRLTLPANLADGFEKADSPRVRPEHPHWPLVIMLVLTQMSVGALCMIAGFGVGLRAQIGAIAALMAGHLALGASTAHLGRPIHAYRALKMWKRSWLSREVLSFTLFAGAASAYAGALFLEMPGATLAGILTAATGIAGILCSAYIYRVPARPSWNSWTTVAEFYLTAALLGPLFAWCFLGAAFSTEARWIVAAAAMGQLLMQVAKLIRYQMSEEFELRQTAALLMSPLRKMFLARLVLLAITATVALAGSGLIAVASALTIGFAAEILGRYLFFVSVVPRNIAASFFGSVKAAA